MEFLKNVLTVNANDASLQSKGGGVFGLNTGNIVEFSFNDKAGTGGSEGNAVDINIQIEDKKFNTRLFLNETVRDSKNNDLSPQDAGYEEAFAKHYTQVVAVVKHGLGALGITNQQIDAAIATVAPQSKAIDTVVEAMKVLTSLVPANYASIPVDIFLEYQWSIGKDQDRTFLTVPRNMKGGYFLCPKMPVVGSWQEVSNEDGLHYVDGNGNKHIFTRSKNFMESPKATQQFSGEENNTSAANPLSAIAAGNAATATPASNPWNTAK